MSDRWTYGWTKELYAQIEKEIKLLKRKGGKKICLMC